MSGEKAAQVRCNPIDLSYRVQNLVAARKHTVFREAADPSVVLFQGAYYLFASMSGGFWMSPDLANWTFVATPELPNYDYAPDVRVVDEMLVVCASRRGKACDFYRTDDPASGSWERVPGTIAFWDPNLFEDDDGRLYLYEGCDANVPIGGRELDRRSLRPISKRVPLIASDTSSHGWEVPATDWDPQKFRRSLGFRLLFGRRPFIEGAWMTKHDGRYYLQYAGPGTEFNTYSDGYYTSDSPLGPFEFAASSPFSSKPGGFIPAAGHGSTFHDGFGNWWHAATMSISVHHPYERRVGLFPADFDDEGVLFCNQEFADYPYVVPARPADPWSLTGNWMLLSKTALVSASSERPGHPATLAVEDDVRSWWSAASAEPGEWLQVTLPEGCSVSAIQVNTIEPETTIPAPMAGEGMKTIFGHRATAGHDTAVAFRLEISVDGLAWSVVRDAMHDGRPHDLTVLEAPAPARYVRVTGGASALGSPFSVSGLRVFGLGQGDAPPPVVARAERVSETAARISWTGAESAHGYNVRYGTAENKLYSCWQVDESGELVLRSLNSGVDYWVAVDAFNQNGVTRGTAIRVPGVSAT